MPFDHNTPQYPSGAAPSFRLDEGFSEDTASLDENNRAEYTQRLQEWLMSQSEDHRMEIAYEILQTLQTSRVAALVDRLTPMLHMDPVEKLPAEIASQIFGYLDAPTLLTACLASHSWRNAILDTRLWQLLFESQGWGIDRQELKAFEQYLQQRSNSRNRNGKNRVISDDISEQPKQKKRATSDLLDNVRRQTPVDLPNWGEQHGTIEVDSDVQPDGSDQEMVDAPSSVHTSPPRPNKRHGQGSEDEMDFLPGPSTSTLAQLGVGRNEHTSKFRPQLIAFDDKGEEKLNWLYMYKQRHLLEGNWLHGRYSMFQLPDPAYPHEAHSECVYCIQFFGKWLVSGSRDKTLRVWDLETRRLRGKPLSGHLASVLCLQFDPTEEEDIIVSGSSDSSVIIWKFSTGQKIHEIPSAHDESVLNLRFDRRFLVTCSKDKKVKIWNRHLLSPAEPDFPRIKAAADTVRAPSHIIDLGGMEPSLMEAKLANGTIKPIKAWSHLLTFVSHVAAVNAIQIQGDIVVSASGDRTIKVWNVNTGKLMKSLSGHLKGIACVQFDSKRIVSGSSDNTVRIYDPISGVEVAVLNGHSNLVRTVQAGFGDLPDQAQNDLDAIRQSEARLLRDMEEGHMPDDRDYMRKLRNGDFGTSRASLGSKLPPGGGGSKWGKIVSGSYDESIIIWRKNAQGDWVVGLTLRQGPRARSRPRHAAPQPPGVVPLPLPLVAPGPAPTPMGMTPAPQAMPATMAASTPVPPNTPSTQISLNPAAIMTQAVNTSFSTLGAGLSNVMGIARNLNGPRLNVPPRSSSGQSASSSAGPAANDAWGNAQIVNGTLTASYNMSLNQNGQQRIHQHQHTINLNPNEPPAAGPSVPHTAPATQPAPIPLQPAALVDAPIAQPGPANAAPRPNDGVAPGVSVSRVFKLQFDARRIVCCSQDSRIIGWDFADNNQDIIDCSRFFVGA